MKGAPLPPSGHAHLSRLSALEREYFRCEPPLPREDLRRSSFTSSCQTQSRKGDAGSVTEWRSAEGPSAMEAAGSVFPELAAGRTVFVLRLDPEKSPAGSPVSLYVREEASRTPLEPWEKARWWWSESKERPGVKVTS